MQPRLLMTLSAAFMGAIGVTMSFLPQEIISQFGRSPEPLGITLVQITGALYLGFAILNWMARGNLIGGIYSRPVALGNFMQFGIVAIVLIKSVMAGNGGIEFTIAAVAVSCFAAWFGIVLFTAPALSREAAK
jgi:hypothetical protein